MSKRRPVFQNVRSLTVAAMLTALSVVIGIFCKNFLNFGAGLFRISFENFPILLSGFLFGPIVGCVVGVATDIISYLLSGQIYPPNLLVTLGAGLIGAIAGIVFRTPVQNRHLRIALSVSAAHLIGSMVVKTIGLYQYYGIAVLWRLPIYFLIAVVETVLLCILLDRSAIRDLIEHISKETL